jgi:ATP-dependent DNA ligase
VGPTKRIEQPQHDRAHPPAPTIVRRLSGFIEPCLPSKAARPPSGPFCVQEIKHDGYRLMVGRDDSRVRCITRYYHRVSGRGGET